MHLYVGVCLRENEAGQWEARAPDLPDASATARTSGEALARVRLALEGVIAGRLGRGEPLPEPRTLDTLRAEAPDSGDYFEVHINLRHLGALATHQQGRWNPPA